MELLTRRGQVTLHNLFDTAPTTNNLGFYLPTGIGVAHKQLVITTCHHFIDQLFHDDLGLVAKESFYLARPDDDIMGHVSHALNVRIAEVEAVGRAQLLLTTSQARCLLGDTDSNRGVDRLVQGKAGCETNR